MANKNTIQKIYYEIFSELMKKNPEGVSVFVLENEKIIEKTMTCYNLKHGSTKDFSGYSAQIYLRNTYDSFGEWFDYSKVFLNKESLIKHITDD